VYGSTYLLATAEKQTISVPRWYQYCLGIDLVSATASFAINSVIKSQVSIPMLVSNKGNILRSKLIPYNEMFSFVNIHSTSINVTNMTAYGDILAWNISDWNRSVVNGFPTEIIQDSSFIWGASDGSHTLIIDSPMNFDTINGLCNRIGPGVRNQTKHFYLNPVLSFFNLKGTVSCDFDGLF
jgi:hypothetical protein